jgi:hypothetical protein
MQPTAHSVPCMHLQLHRSNVKDSPSLQTVWSWLAAHLGLRLLAVAAIRETAQSKDDADQQQLTLLHVCCSGRCWRQRTVSWRKRCSCRRVSFCDGGGQQQLGMVSSMAATAVLPCCQRD